MMSATESVDVKEIVRDVAGGQLKLHIKHDGTGDPVIFLHNAAGPRWDPFLRQLALSRTVYAPEHPGTTDGDPDAIDRVHELWDLVLIYEEAIRSLGFDRPPVCIGASVGGMLAAELAATFPNLFSKLVLIAPAGLWREDPAPREWLTSDPAKMAQRLFLDPSRPTVADYLKQSDDPEIALKQRVQAIWSTGCTGKFLWPLPDRGLRRRLHRIEAPTLILWGSDDDITPAAYAQDFGEGITGSVVKLIPDSGHVVQIEQRETVIKHVLNFLDGA